MARVLFIARNSKGINTGASVITQRNFDMLRYVYDNHNVEVIWLFPETSVFKTLVNTLKFSLAGYDSLARKLIQNKLGTNQFDHVFIDTSLTGKCAKLVKQQNCNIKVSVFFHNAELEYYKSLLLTTYKIWHLLSLAAIWFNENMGIKYANELVFLNQRDKKRIFQQYKVSKNTTYKIIPTSMWDRFDETMLQPSDNGVLNVLFVGTLFFPNYHGLMWFVKEVLPYVNIKLSVVGRGFETIAKEFINPKINVVGSVDSIDSHYYSADLVIAPIFKGSGMKTKLAEALMFGKTVLASTESFEGYEINYNEVGALCNSANEYINAINGFEKSPLKFNPNSREVFLKYYDFKKSCAIYAETNF